MINYLKTTKTYLTQSPFLLNVAQEQKFRLFFRLLFDEIEPLNELESTRSCDDLIFSSNCFNVLSINLACLANICMIFFSSLSSFSSMKRQGNAF